MKSMILFIFLFILSFVYNNSLFANYQYIECESIDEKSLRSELNKLCQYTFINESNKINIAKLVDGKWNAIGIDNVINSEVDSAIKKVKDDQGILNSFLSGWSEDKAKALADKVSTIAFSSEALKQSLDQLALEVSNSLSQEIEVASAESASTALLCIQQFIGKKYSSAIVSAFNHELKHDLKKLNLKDQEINSSFIKIHKLGIGGLGLIIGQKIAKRMGTVISKRISQGLMKRIGGRFIPVVGWTMLIYDITSNIDGALPTIQKSLKSQEIKDKIKDDITKQISFQLRQEYPQIAREISNNIYSIWLDFKAKFKVVLDLSQENDNFKIILNNAQKDDFLKISNLVNISISSIGKEKLVDSLNDGSFERVFNLPSESAWQILITSKSMKKVIEWADLSGNRIDDIVKFEIYKHKNPEDFNKDSIDKLLELNDKGAIAKIILLDKPSIDSLLKYSTDSIVNMVNKLSIEDLKSLINYLDQFDQKTTNTIIAYIIQNPLLLSKLNNQETREFVIRSENKNKTLSYLFSPDNVIRDIFKIPFDKDISIDLLFYKYNAKKLYSIIFILIFMLLIFVVIVILIIKKIIAPGKTNVIINLQQTDKNIGDQ